MINEKDESKLVGILQSLDQELSQLNSRLTEIEQRLTQVEASQIGSQKILDERHVPARMGQLGGRVISSSPQGTVQRQINIVFCDVCGRKIEEENLALCYGCKRKICVDKCLIKLGAEFLCIECLKDRLPLDKKGYKILVAIANGLTNVKEISKITSMVTDDVRTSTSELLNLGLIRRKGISIAKRIETTDDGLEAMGAFHSIYSSDEDVLRFEQELTKHLLRR